MLRCSVGITAYNEQDNIGPLLEAMIDQHLHDVEICEIIVVASGCTDNTVRAIDAKTGAEYRIHPFCRLTPCTTAVIEG